MTDDPTEHLSDAFPDPPPLPAPETELALPDVPWRWWEAFVVFVFTFVTSAILGIIVAGLSDGDVEKALAVVVFEVSLGFWAVAWVKLFHGMGPVALGWRRDRIGSDVGFGLGAGIVGWLLSTLVVGNITIRIVDALSETSIEEPDQLDFTNPSTAVLAITAVGVMVIAPIAEELFFRGFVFRAFHRDMPFAAAAVASGVLFMVAHLPFWLIFPSILTLGVVLAWTFHRSRSLIPVVIAHALFNSIGFAVYLLSLN